VQATGPSAKPTTVSLAPPRQPIEIHGATSAANTSAGKPIARSVSNFAILVSIELIGESLFRPFTRDVRNGSRADGVYRMNDIPGQPSAVAFRSNRSRSVG
jgi:hypothetical protein